MFDARTIEFFRNRFEGSIGKFDWAELSEQVLCCFLERHHREILQGGEGFLKEFLGGLRVSHEEIALGYLPKTARQKSLVVGDELGFLRRVHPNSHQACYTAESLKDAQASKCAAFGFFEGTAPEAAYSHILVLELMEQLQRTGTVRNLGLCLKKLLELCSPKGSILIVDRRRVQDDFVCQFVSLGAEIEDLEQLGEDDFRLLVRP